jgi:hypothetical protein
MIQMFLAASTGFEIHQIEQSSTGSFSWSGIVLERGPRLGQPDYRILRER